MKQCGGGRAIDEVSGTPAKQGKHQRTTSTGRTSSPTGRTCWKIGSGQVLPVEL